MADKASSKSGEKIGLIVASLGVAALAGWTIMNAQNVPEKFSVSSSGAQGSELGEIPTEQVKQSLTDWSTKLSWTTPTDKGRNLRLFTSVPVVQKAGSPELVDMMDPKSPPLRPPMTNEFLVEHSLEFQRSDVGEMDPDQDGFSNLEEFNAKTNPKDPKSHPPFTDKLFLAQMLTEEYVITFGAVMSDRYQIRRSKPDNATRGWFVPLDGLFGEDRFKILAFEKKQMPNERGINTDVSEIKVHDSKWNEDFTMVLKQPVHRDEYTAVFQYRLLNQTRSAPVEIRCRKREEFQIPDEPGKKYRVVDVTASGATIAPVLESGELGENIQISLLVP